MAAPNTVPSARKYLLDSITKRPVFYELGKFTFLQPLQTQSQVVTTTTATISDNISEVYVDPSTALASLTLTLPPNPQDGDFVTVLFGGTIAGGATVVTALTVQANTGQGIVDKGTGGSFVGGASVCYQWRNSNSKWYRVF